MTQSIRFIRRNPAVFALLTSFIVATLLLVAFFFSQNAIAAIVYSQADKSSRNTFTIGNFGEFDTRFQTFQAVSGGTIEGITIYAKGAGAFPTTMNLAIYSAVSATDATGALIEAGPNFSVPSRSISSANYTVILDNPVSLTAGEWYAIRWSWVSGGDVQFWGSASDAVSGQCMNRLGASCVTLSDIFYALDGGLGPSSPQEIKVAVILAETKDADMAANTRDRIKNDDPLATDDIDSLLRSYFCENSFGDYDEGTDTCSGGLINIELEIIDNNGQPFELDKDIGDYGENFFFGEKPYSVGFDGSEPQREIKLDSAKDKTIDLLWEAINKADSYYPLLDFNKYEVVIVVYEGRASTGVPGQISQSSRPETFAWPVQFAPSGSPDELAKNWIPLAEEWEVGAWAHELAHVLGEVENDKYLCDLFESDLGCGTNVDELDLMGTFGPHLGSPAGSQPSNLSSYSKLDIGWFLNESDLSQGPFSVVGLNQKTFGAEVETVFADDEAYYIVEARTSRQPYGGWDASLPDQDALIIYRVDEIFKTETVYPEQQEESVPRNEVNIERIIRPGDPPFIDEENDISVSADLFDVSTGTYTVFAQYNADAAVESRTLGVLNPNNQIPESIAIGSVVLGVPDPNYKIPRVQIVKYAFKESLKLQEYARYGWFLYSALIVLAILLLYSWLSHGANPRMQRDRFNWWLLFSVFAALIISYGIALAVHVNEYPRSIEDRLNYIRQQGPTGSRPLYVPDPNAGPVASPDLDLHAYDDQGNHVGMNYVTGLYENTIPNANTSGERRYANEWISVPEGTNVTFEVRSDDIEQFFAENPDIEASLASTEETYAFGAVTYDASSNRYESAPVENIVINPGETRVHEIGGTTEAPTVDEGTVVVELDPVADTYLRNGSKNKNYGTETTTWIKGSGKRKTLVQFDQQAISDAVGTGTLVSATLEMATVDGSSGSWTSNGKLVGPYRLTHPWTELGATWNCGNDIDTSDSSPDCDGETWEMNQSKTFSWIEPPLDQVLFTNDTTGTISWDVTQDVADFIATTATNYGWVVRKDKDGASGRIQFQSRETPTPPRLILEFVR